MNFYIAAPFDTEEKRANATKVKEILSRDKNNSVFCPWEYKVPQAWEYPNSEWGLMVFMNDIKAIDSCDIVIMLSYGRNSTAGTNWEACYAFGTNKKVIVVEIGNPKIMSLMVANGRYATVHGIEGLEKYPFSSMPKLRSSTEQK